MTKRIPRDAWRQVDGDMNPGTYGGTIARYQGEAIELLEIQPVREYVGDGEALEVGFPFWTREAYYYFNDLDPAIPEVAASLRAFDLDPMTVDPEYRIEAIACACMRCGYQTDEGQGGWAKDVLGDRRVYWNYTVARHGRPQGWRYLADEDREFRALQREARKNRAA